ncbi:cyclic nucleotide-binding domain-containing protein [Bacterioplanoides sp. SCSIO 12839]|uniref:cyclic nucleotide-binding domain-containing protein n=1 Tax=Bacterioplanoides sp. SCSIO 12839 TaxID=2829569 RepID=UPI002106D7F9|nr:cyclic nucleotide-binding domain-containing protein [Bacterioplanoides sp. SCSIO 12839]UTW49180.1 cyclic nucleotide-binding domain-containing protein [Bacterioplanoides sp. SCSIO 12839]
MESTLRIEQIQHFVPFDELSEATIEELMPHFRYHQLNSKQILFKRGVEDDECHFLLSGELDLADDQFNITKIHGEEDENFLALDSSHPVHRCAAITQSACSFFSIKRQYLELITTWSELRQSYEEQDEEADWLEALLTSRLFNRIPPANIQQLLMRFNERRVALGEVIIKEGDSGQECYVIKSGKAVVTRMNNGKPETLAAITTGTLFGEDALNSALPRNATVTMSSDGELMVLTQDDFNRLLKNPVLEYLNEAQLHELIEDGDTGTIVIDVRTRQESIAHPLPKARNIPLAKLRSELPGLSPEFVYVTTGEARGEAAAYILNEAGFQTKVLRFDEHLSD